MGSRTLAGIQGAYFLITGIWPLVHMPSFLWVTGDKTDLWLVETVGVLVIAIGLALLVARHTPLPPISIIVMAIASSAGLASIEVINVLEGTILPVYLGDAVLEMIFITWWCILLAKHRALLSASTGK